MWCKKSFVIVLVFLVLSFSATLANAELMLGQPKAVYNIGDEIQIPVTISVNENTDGFVKMYLSCESATKDFFLVPLVLSSGEKKSFDAKVSLSKSFVGEMKGLCNIIVSYLEESSTSQSFEVSDSIEVTASLSKLSFNPGEKVGIKGRAIKPNTQNAIGFFDIELVGSDIKTSGIVEEGRFSANFSFPENTKPGKYVVNVVVYEKDTNGDTTNRGGSSIPISLAQVPSKIDIAIDSQTVAPGNNAVFKVFVYDQSNEEIQTDAKIFIKNSDDEITYQRLVKTGESIIYDISKNNTPGYWKIKAEALNLNVERLFYVEQKEIAEFELIGDVLTITNVGNVPYTKAVQIAIGNAIEVKEMDLDIGQSQRFRLVAPDGNYPVSITDGENEVKKSDVQLTGNVIGVLGIRGEASIWKKYPIVWLFLIMIFTLFIIMVFQRSRKGKFVGYEPVTFKDSKAVEQKQPIKKIGSDGLSLNQLRAAEQGLVKNGKEEQVSLISLYVKNLDSIKNKDILKSIENSLNALYDHKGVLYKNGNYLIGMLTPSLTKTFKNEVNAVKIATAISNKLNDINKRFKDKIDFGLGIHTGNIISEKEDNIFKFTGKGNSIALPKRISDISKGEVLLSKDAASKVAGAIKTNKQEKFGLELYSIEKIADREQHKQFIDKFLRRIGK